MVPHPKTSEDPLFAGQNRHVHRNCSLFARQRSFFKVTFPATHPPPNSKHEMKHLFISFHFPVRRVALQPELIYKGPSTKKHLQFEKALHTKTT